MPDDQQNDVDQELVTQQEPEVASDDVSEDIQEQPAKKSVDYNWNEARRRMRDLERVAQEQQEIIEKLKKPQEEDLTAIHDDEIITAKQARALAQKMAKQAAEEALRQRDIETLEDRMRAKFSDFDEIVSEENINFLNKNEPEIAASLKKLSNDPYLQAITAYKMIKNIRPKTSSEQSIEKKKALQNSQKPVSAQSVAKNSAIGNAHLFENGLTEELKKQLYKEMMQAIQG